jgi:RNA polymerase sigma factor (sigma-70 family)
MPIDQELMLRVKEGELTCMKQLFQIHSKALLGYFLNKNLGKADAEDLVQETFWRMLRYRSSYNPRYSFRSWMYQIARNRQLDFLGKYPDQLELNETTVPLPIREEDSIPIDVAKKEERSLLLKALNQLPEEKRELLVLARFQELSHKEIAETLNCKVGTVKVRLHRALESLRNLFLKLNEVQVS